VGFRSLPGFEPLFALPREARLAALRDPDQRKRLLGELAAVPPGSNRMFLESLARHSVSDVGPPELQHLVGQPLAELAARRGTSLIETMLDLACEARLDIGFEYRLVPVATAEQRALRRRVLRDPRLMLGASDGGAHVRGVINVEYPTASFQELVRESDVFTREELIAEFTGVPARFYGLVDRGRLEPGAWADLVIFDPDTIGASPVEMRRDLPGGAPRLYNHGLGIDAVFVAGEEIVRAGEFTGRHPGRVLRSGRDSRDPSWGALLERRRERAA
jgi:N-acyl-D-aspartate/D-glutamate deacylase